jgi:GH24 family phage-related lysozyme (muramidase)
MCSPDRVYSAGKHVERKEGRRRHVYIDSEGNPSIGIGFNLHRPGAALALSRVGANYDDLVSGRADLSELQIDALFARDLADSIEAAADVCPSLGSLPLPAQIALVDMAFNLGRTGLAGFRGMLAAIARGDMETAAVEALDSLWARQVGERAVEDAALLRKSA